MPFLSSFRIERALRRLAELSASEHLVLGVALCHGAVMTLAYPDPKSRIASPRMVEPAGRTEILMRRVASEQRLPADWLREDVRYYLAVFAARGRTDFDLFGPNLTLSVAESGHVLALKLHACECYWPPAEQDLAEVEFLVQKLGVDSWADVASLYERFLPGCSLGGDVRTRVLEMFVPARKQLRSA